MGRFIVPSYKRVVDENREHVLSFNNRNEQDFLFIIRCSSLKNGTGTGKKSISLMLGTDIN